MKKTIDALEPFDAQFVALMGVRPFSWQKRLFRDHFISGHLPSALDLPTGLGKTSVMAVWYLALKAGATLPRRLVYVVDRRAVVDQATTIADQIKEKSRDLKLRVSTLRGQHVDNREWQDDPATPAIIVGTVDMIGSRLLFFGYGVSRKMRPYHAGLLGVDALVVLDEAHLVPPFEKLLEAIEGGAQAFGPRAGDGKIVPPFQLLSLSATGRMREGEVFRLGNSDLEDEIVGKRLRAKKAIEIVKDGDQKIEQVMASQAWQLADNGASNIRCLVYCDSREAAEKTKLAIEGLAKGDKRKDGLKIEVETELFVGARRVKERQGAAHRLEELGFVAGKKTEYAKPAFLIATSAGEVGVDLDADHMVCDLVPWERMVQRLGRVNRRGEGDARIVVIDEGEPRPKTPSEPTAGELRAICAYRALAIIGELSTNSRGIDASPGALRDLKLRAESDPNLQAIIDAATTPVPLRPPLTRALIDAWSLTSLEKHTGRPDIISPWLRGWIEDEPRTSIVWRKYLPVREGDEVSHHEIEDFFDAAPPHASEILETETWRVVDWLITRAKAALEVKQKRPTEEGEITHDDDEDARPVTPLTEPLKPTTVVAFALSPAGERRKNYNAKTLADPRNKEIKDDLNTDLAGLTLVVDARMGGLDLTSGILDKAKNAPTRAADDGGEWLAPLPDGTPVVRFRVQSPRGAEAPISIAKKGYVFATRRSEEGEDEQVLYIESWATKDARAASPNPQLLEDHQSLVKEKAYALAKNLSLPQDYVEVLAIAARLHDEGKRAHRWQRAFNAAGDGIYAKTKGPINQARLDGYRHEFGSLPWVEKDEAFAKLQPDQQDPVLHLIAAHHGNARPVIEARGCDDGPPSMLDGRARAVALRFSRLQKRWGPWGLAWWEALLRAADQQGSRENDAADEKSKTTTTVADT